MAASLLDSLSMMGSVHSTGRLTDYWRSRHKVQCTVFEPLTSIPSKQVFSTVGDILTDKRNCVGLPQDSA